MTLINNTKSRPAEDTTTAARTDIPAHSPRPRLPDGVSRLAVREAEADNVEGNDSLDTPLRQVSVACSPDSGADTPDSSCSETAVDDDTADIPAYDIAIFPTHKDPRRNLPPLLRRHVPAGAAAAYRVFGSSNRIAKRPPSGRRRLACPFVAHNPARRPSSHTCLVDHDMRALRLHAGSVHRRPIACPLCGERLASRAAFDTHVVARTCERPGAPMVRVEGVTDTQLLRLAQRGDAALSEAEQWTVVWRALFPREEPPASPHLPHWLEKIAAKADLVRDFWGREGMQVTSAFVRRSGLVGDLGSAAGLDVLERFSEAVLQEMVDGLYSSECRHKERPRPRNN